jgi:hypothetical protein
MTVMISFNSITNNRWLNVPVFNDTINFFHHQKATQSNSHPKEQLEHNTSLCHSWGRYYTATRADVWRVWQRSSLVVILPFWTWLLRAARSRLLWGNPAVVPDASGIRPRVNFFLWYTVDLVRLIHSQNLQPHVHVCRWHAVIRQLSARRYSVPGRSDRSLRRPGGQLCVIEPAVLELWRDWGSVGFDDQTATSTSSVTKWRFASPPSS